MLPKFVFIIYILNLYTTLTAYSYLHRLPLLKSNSRHTSLYSSNFNNVNDNVKSTLSKSSSLALFTLNALSILLSNNKANAVANIDEVNTLETTAKILTRNDVGFINLNDTLPTVTDVAWMDIQIGESDPQRIEISLFGIIQYSFLLLMLYIFIFSSETFLML